MTEIEQDLVLVELSDQLVSELAEPAIGGLETAIAHQVAAVVAGLHDAHTEAVKHSEAIQLSVERARVLEAVDDAHATGRLRSGEIATRQYLHEVVGMPRDFFFG